MSTLYVHIPACTQEKIKAMEDSLYQCGEKGKDWTFDAIPTSPEHVRRFKVRTDMVETVRDICAQYNYILRTSL